MPMTAQELAEIAQEIRDHGKTWCSPKCQTFLPSCYEAARMKYGKKVAQSDYDLTHIFR